MTLEEALLKIAELEGRETTLQAEKTGLQDEKTALLRKRDELLGKLTKFKQFEAHADVDIEALLKTKELYDSQDTELKATYEAAYTADKERLEKRLETRIGALEQERQREASERLTEKAQLLAERTRSLAITELSKSEHGVFNSEQLYRLIGDRVRLDDAGKPVVGDEYKVLTLPDYLKELKADLDYQNQFRASGVTGSGGMASNVTPGTSAVNPWKAETWNLTQQGKIYRDSPALATSLKVAAGIK